MKFSKKVTSLCLAATLLFGTTSAFAADWCKQIPSVSLDAHHRTECAITKAYYDQLKTEAANVDQKLKAYESAAKAAEKAGINLGDFGPAFIWGGVMLASGYLSTLPVTYLMFEPIFAAAVENLSGEVMSITVKGVEQQKYKDKLLVAARNLETAKSSFETVQLRLKQHHERNNCIKNAH